MAIDLEEKRSENVQTMLKPSEKKELEWMAEQEQRSVSDMARILLLDSLKIWGDSNPGRKRREK